VESQFGYRRDELLGQKVTNIIPGGFAERLVADGIRTNAEALAQQIGTGIELNGRRKDGSEFPIDIMLSPLVSPEGTLVTAAIRDITVQKERWHQLMAQNWALSAYAIAAMASARARSLEDLLKAVCESIVRESIYVLAFVGIAEDSPGKPIRVIAAAGSALGYMDGLSLSWAEDEPTGQGPAGNCIRNNELQNVPDTGTAANYAFWRERAKQFGVRSSLSIPLHVEGGWQGVLAIYAAHPYAFEAPAIEVFQHLAEQVVHAVHALNQEQSLHQVEVDLVESEARYRGLMEAAPDGMVVVNQDGEVVLLNARAEKQFGYHRDELLGQKVTDIIPEGFAERLIADALRTTAEALAQQIGTGIELLGRRKNGTMFPIEIMLSPLESAEGVLVTAAIRDISGRKQLEHQLLQSQKMEAIGQLTGGIAHDFNNLLGVIIGNLDLLDRLVAGNEAAIKRVRTAQKAAMRGADITRRLLLFSSNEKLKPSVVLLGDSIQNMIELAGPVLGAEIKITTHIDESAPPLFIEPAGLESALLNLVMNARDALPGGGSIVISSQIKNVEDSHPAVQTGELKAGRYVCVSVTDTGSGMSKETLGRAFEPFFTTKLRGKGTGLGLAMVYGFVRRSGGAVRVYSELGQGTTVSLYLPLAADLSQPLPTGAPAPKALNTKLNGTVLVVDDEVELLEIALAYLAEMGFTSYEAIDGASALEMIAQHSEIELMVTDIVMHGGMNGVELAQKARALRPGLRIIYSSGFPVEALAEKSLPLIDGPLLNKPYQRAEFAEIIHRVMEGYNPALAK
jgi:PAS domain S-box-containing protein